MTQRGLFEGHRRYFSVESPTGTCNIMILSILRALDDILRKMKFLPLTYNGQVMKLT